MKGVFALLWLIESVDGSVDGYDGSVAYSRVEFFRHLP
jgi:hypothetical protein